MAKPYNNPDSCSDNSDNLRKYQLDIEAEQRHQYDDVMALRYRLEAVSQRVDMLAKELDVLKAHPSNLPQSWALMQSRQRNWAKASMMLTVSGLALLVGSIILPFRVQLPGGYTLEKEGLPAASITALAAAGASLVPIFLHAKKPAESHHKRLMNPTEDVSSSGH